MVQHIGLNSENVHGEIRSWFGKGKSIDLRILDLAKKDGTCLRFIDPYGDTVFNPLQIPELISELIDLKSGLRDDEFCNNIDEVIGFLESEETAHLFVRFTGD